MTHGKASTYTRQNNIEKPGRIALAEARFKPEIRAVRKHTQHTVVGKIIDIRNRK
jgi:hypothetical protein